MKITAQEEYGLRCLMCLAAAGEGESLTIPEIAASEGLSQPHVAKLLAALRNGGLIESVRGRSGGYRLATPASEIKLGTVLSVLGEPLFQEPDYCQKHAGTEANGFCVHHGACSLRALWQTLEDWMRHTLDQITLADLAQDEVRITELLKTRLAEAVLEPTTPLIALGSLKTVTN